MYSTTNHYSSKHTLHSHPINDTAYSFADQFRHPSSPYEVNKKLSQQPTSYPLNYNSKHSSRGSQQHTFNSGWSNELSKIEQLNSKISRTTEEILLSKSRSRVSEHDHHLTKQPEEKKRKYFRQYVRYEPTVQSRNNYGHEPVIIRRQIKDNESEGKRSRKSSVKINFMYQNSPSRKNSYQSGIDKFQRPEKDIFNTPRNLALQSPVSSNNYLNGYRSTELILANNKDLTRKSSLKKDVKFIYESTNNREDDNPNKRSAVSTYEAGNYSSKKHERISEDRYGRNSQKEAKIKMTGSSYLQENFGRRSSQQSENFFQKQKQKRQKNTNQGFYQTQDYEFEDNYLNSLREPRGRELDKSHKDVFYDMQSPQKSKPEAYLFKQPITATPRTQIPPIQTNTNIPKTFEQMKDKQSRLIALVLIALALIIFILQLVS